MGEANLEALLERGRVLRASGVGSPESGKSLSHEGSASEVKWHRLLCESSKSSCKYSQPSTYCDHEPEDTPL